MGSVRKKGDRWYFSIELPQENGKRKRIERSGGKTKKEALQKMALMEAEILKKGYKEECKITVAELLDIWYQEYVELNCKGNTKSSRKRMIETHLKPYLGNYKLKDVNTRIIQNFFNDKSKEGYSKSTLNMLKAILNSSFKYAIFPLEFIENNPVQNITMPKRKDVKDKHIITSEEMDIILKTANKELKRMVMQFAYYTGMRSSEICGLQWEDVDFDNKVIHINHNLITSSSRKNYTLDTPKTKGSKRDIFIDDMVISILKKQRISQKENQLKYGELYIKNDLVFTKENGHFLSNHLLADWVTYISKKTDIPFSMHSFRHTHATILLEAGVSAKDIQTRLGHSDISTTLNIYVKSTELNQKNAAKTFENYVQKIKTSDI